MQCEPKDTDVVMRGPLDDGGSETPPIASWALDIARRNQSWKERPRGYPVVTAADSLLGGHVGNPF